MIERVFAELPENFAAGAIDKPLTIYFSVEEIKKTVHLTAERCQVENGKTTDQADCVCKISGEMLLRIWEEGYRPGVGDFLSGQIRSNNPAILQKFLTTCRRSG